MEQETTQAQMEEAEAKAQEQKPMVDYGFGDLYVKCSCGGEDLLAEGIKGGVRFDLYTLEGQEVKLGCSKCGQTMSLFFKEAKNIEALKAAELEKQISELVPEDLFEEVLEENIEDVEYSNESI